MLNKNFNRFGGTEIRTKHQVDFYIMLCEWIKKMQKDEKNFPKTNDEWDQKFKKWAKEEQIYSYKNDKVFKNRFGFITHSLEKLGIHHDNFQFNIPEEINGHTIFQSLLIYKNNDVFPFREMIKFAFANPIKNNAKQIILSFLVYDGQESFLDLYNKDIIKELANSAPQEVPKFRKPPDSIYFIKKVFHKKQSGKLIEEDDFINYDPQKDNYIRKIFFKDKKKYDLYKMISKLNQIDFPTFVYKLYYIKFSQTLKKDYLDLFSRWLYDFGLVDTSGKKVATFYNHKLKKQNNTYYIERKENSNYPWKFEEVDIFIKEIAGNNFNFKYNNDDLKYVANSTLAEYFVNLYYAYKLNISPRRFREFVNTKVSDRLKPIFTAPGGKPDMSFSNQKVLINVETTINSTKRTIQNNEIFPCTRHYEEIASQSQASSRYLIFVSPVEPNTIKEDFEIVFKNKKPQGILMICQFNNLQFPNLENF